MLLWLRFGMDKKAVDRTIRQLRYGGVLRDMGAYVLAADRRFDIQLARAVDISLALSGSRAPDIFPRKKPVFLTAYLPEREVRLCVLYVPVGKEPEALPYAGQPAGGKHDENAVCTASG